MATEQIFLLTEIVSTLWSGNTQDVLTVLEEVCNYKQ
jgi:hypothetical protein